MELIFVPLHLMALVFMVAPPAALVPGLLFGWLLFSRRQVSAAVAAAAWLLYAGYESLMYLRILCTGECNIRIDLFVIYPVLLLLSLLALFMLWWRGRKTA